jgi:hydrogenase maturation factor HypF (carbamoyltransferase family)
MKRRSESRMNPDAMSMCRDCGRQTSMPRAAYFRASAPRCPDCGGWLDLSESARKDLAKARDARIDNRRFRP